LSVPPWTDPAWLAEAHEWIDERDARLGVRRRATEQPHVRPWSTVIRVPTTEGDLWFKANVPVLAYEAGVVEVLSRTRPDAVPALVGVDRERGWMLMRDGGERLREIVERERDLGRWHDILPRYGQLQLDLAGYADELVALGAPDRRLSGLTRQYAQLVEHVDGLKGTERDRLYALAPEVSAMCARLARLDVPETVQHDDLHDGQVFVRDGSYLFFDWGDSCVSHPFFTMSVTLEGQLSWGLDDVEDSVDIVPYRDSYLEPFAAYADRPELEEAFATALRLGWICRALNVHMFGVSVDASDRAEWAERVCLRLQMFAGENPPAMG
jgi:hypothetical protein